MKKLVVFFFLAFGNVASFAQQGVAINADGSLPNASAMLDIKSTSRGILLPRMTSPQRLAIVSPARGLMVYDNTTNSFWFHNGTSWQEMNPASGNSAWNTNNTHLYNSNAGNVGIGIFNPVQKLHVGGNIRVTGRLDAEGVVEAQGLSSLGSLYVLGNSLFQGSITGGSTAEFGGIVSSNVGMEIGNDAGSLKFKKGNGLVAGSVGIDGDDLWVATAGTNMAGRFVVYAGSNSRMVVQSDGLVGIGTSTPLSRLHINSGTANGVLRLQSSNFPTLHFNRNENQVASIQASDTWLNILSSGGQVRLNNQLYVDDAVNRVGIGTSSPDQKLHVAGSAKISTGQLLNNDDKNMLPIAYGKFDRFGIKQNGTSNISCSVLAAADFIEYRIVVQGADMSNAVVNVTPFGACRTVTVSTFAGGANIYFYNCSSDELSRSDFSVIIHN